ncbi:MAG: zinc-binding alcohol dehydrogenase family protein [Acidimicrobiales bacterium]
MKVVGVIEHGGPDALQIIEVPDPAAGPGTIRIRVHAATVNPTDTYVRNGARAAQQKDQTAPYVPGMDAAGVVDQIGDGTETDLQVGDHVMAIVLPDGSHGAYSELLVVPAQSAVRVPAGVDDAAASTLPMNGLTAQLGLDLMGLQPGQTLAVTGAAGCYGGYTVQLAKAAGLRVIADASEADTELVRSLGADVVVPRGPDVAAAIRAVVPEGVDGLADGSVQDAALFGAIKDGGCMATVRGFKGPADRDITVHPIWVRDYWKARDKLDGLRQLVEAGAVTLRVADTVPKEQAAEAHRRLEAGGTRGRLVIRF